MSETRLENTTLPKEAANEEGSKSEFTPLNLLQIVSMHPGKPAEQRIDSSRSQSSQSPHNSDFGTLFPGMMLQAERLQEVRLKPAQILDLAASEKKASALVRNPQKLSRWVDRFLAASGKESETLGKQFEKFLAPALKERIKSAQPGSRSSQENALDLSQILTELGRLKSKDPKLSEKVLTNEDFLNLAANKNISISHSTFGNWFKHAKESVELQTTLTWLDQKLNQKESDDGQVSLIASQIPYKESRQLYLDHKARLGPDIEPYELSIALQGLDAQSAGELMDANLGRFPKRLETLAGALTLLPAKVINKYLDEIENSKSSLFLTPLEQLRSGYSQFPKEGLDNERIDKILKVILSSTLETTRELLKSNKKPAYHQMQSLIKSPLLSDREEFLRFYGKWESLSSWHFTDSAQGLGTDDKIKLLDTYVKSLDLGQKESGLKSLKGLEDFAKAGKLKSALEEKLAGLKDDPGARDTKSMEVPESNIENNWKAKDSLLKFEGETLEYALRLKPGLKMPAGGWKFKEGDYFQVVGQISEMHAREMNVYSFLHGGKEVQLRIDKSYDESLRLERSKANANSQIREKALFSPLLPEEIASLVKESIPASGHLRIIEMRKTIEPGLLVQPESPRAGENTITDRAADASIFGGRIRIYTNSRYGIISTLKHEYKHLLQKDPSYKTYQQAVKFESGSWQGKDYGFTNDMEDWAVNSGEIAMGKDSVKFAKFVREAPARAIASLAAIEQVLKTVDNPDESQKKALSARVAYVEKVALSGFQKQIEKSLEKKDYKLLSQQMQFLADLATHSKKPEWAAKILESEAISKLFSSAQTDQSLRKESMDAMLRVAGILESHNAGVYTGFLDREMPLLKARVLELSRSGNGAKEESKAFLELAVSIRQSNPGRALSVLGDAEFLGLLRNNPDALACLDAWYQSARAEGKAESILRLLDADENGRSQLLWINDLSARLKYMEKQKDKLENYQLYSLLRGLDDESRSTFLSTELHRFHDQEGALNETLGELPASWQMTQLEQLRQKKPASALDQIQAIIGRGPDNDLKVLQTAHDVYRSLKPEILNSIYQKLETGKESLSHSEIGALFHDRSARGQALNTLLSYRNIDSFPAFMGLNSLETAQILALQIGKTVQSLKSPGDQFESLQKDSVYKLDQNYKDLVDATLKLSAGANTSLEKSKANPELASSLLNGEALKAFFSSTDAMQRNPSVPAMMIRLAKTLDPDGSQTESYIQSVLMRLKNEIERSSLSSDPSAHKRTYALTKIVQKLWESDPKLGAAFLSHN